MTAALDLVSALRVRHWAKNGLIFVPVITGHRMRDPEALRTAFLCMAAFSLLASAIYLVNDIFDREADRTHPVKRLRAIASGRVSVAAAGITAAVLLALAAVVALWLPEAAQVILLLYAIAAILYSLALKRMLLVDVVVLAVFYAMRILAGGAATQIEISVWLLAFSMFASLSLALIKRVADLQLIENSGAEQNLRRAYKSADLLQLCSLASSSAFAAAVVLALYLNSPEVHGLYRRPRVLWIACPILVYWLSRVILLARRGWLHDDPLVFALSDKVSWVVAVSLVCSIVWAI